MDHRNCWSYISKVLLLLCMIEYCFCTLSDRIGPFPHHFNYTELLDISNKCLPQQQSSTESGFELTCKLHKLSLSDSIESVECISPNVIRVVGEFRVLKLQCVANIPIDLYYYGIQPTEAILVDWFKILKVDHDNDRELHLRQNGQDDRPRIITGEPNPAELNKFFVMDVYIHSVNELHSFFTTAKGQVEKKDYTRSGHYVIRGIFDKTKEANIFMYLEDSAKPSFLRNERTKPSTFVKDGDQYFQIPCIASHYEAIVEITQVSTSQVIFEAKGNPNGLLLNLNKSNTIANMEDSYSCVLKFQDSVVDTLSLTANAGLKQSSIPPFGLDRPLSAGTKNIIRHSSRLDSNGNVDVRVLCHIPDVNNFDHPDNFLANIEIQNFGQMKLVQAFVLPKFINQSYLAERFDPSISDKLLREIRISKVFHLRSGTTYCRSAGDDAFELADYGVSLQGLLVAFGYGLEWANFPRQKADISTHMELTIVQSEEEAGSQLYAGTVLTFKCKTNIVVIFKPTIWYLKWKNGTFTQELIDYDWKGEFSYFTTKAESEIEAVYCFASYWYSTFWRNDTKALNLLDGSPPEFDHHTSSKTDVSIELGHAVLLNCHFNGRPIPKYWLMKVDTGIVLVNETKPQQSGLAYTISSFSNKDAGDYLCIAENVFGKSQQLFQLTVSSTNLYVIIIPPILVFLLTAVAAFVYIKYFRKEKIGLTKEEIQEFLKGVEETGRIGKQGDEFAHEFAHLTPYDDQFEIQPGRYQIDLSCVIGSGAYGTVLRGIVQGEAVAVKTIKKNADKTYLKALLSELKIMIYLGTQNNIIQLVGAHTTELDKGIVYVFVKFCPMGNLEKFLRNNRSHYSPTDEYQNMSVAGKVHSNYFNFNDLVHWSCQIASGMAYLGSKKVIHGDLATRNILLDDNCQVKITDFGLSRQLYDYASYVKKHQEPLPWRWMALEALRDLTFSTYSDIWSYGITLWEIFSLGEVPYPGLSWTLSFVEELENGLRMGKPKQATDYIYLGIIADCWHEVPESRPSFVTIQERFREISNNKGKNNETKSPNEWHPPIPVPSPRQQQPNSSSYMNTNV